MAKAQVRRELRRSDYAKRGLVTLVGVALVLGLIWLRSSGTFGGPEHVFAQVANVGGSLAKGADVKVRGVIVGKVAGVTRGPEGGVRVRVSIDKARLDGVPNNVVGRILPATVFGTSFLDLTTHGASSPTALRAGAVIPPDPTQGTLELQQALDDIDSLVKALGPAELASAIGSTAQALDGRGEQLGRTIDTLDDYLGKLNPKLPLVASDIRKLSTNVQLANQISPDLFKATSDALVTARTIVTEKAAIATLISGGTALTAQANTFLSANQAKLVRFINNSAALLDAVYDNRKAGITGAMATNRLLATKLASIKQQGFGNTLVRLDGNLPPYYTTADCPRFGPVRGNNCAGLARAGVGAIFGGGGSQ